MPPPRSVTLTTSRCGAGLAVDEIVHEAAAGVSEGIPDDFRHRRRDARLLGEVEGARA